MRNGKKRIWALMSAAVTTSALVVSMTGSSVTTVRDADGDGRYTGSDAQLTLRYLNGEFNPSSVRSFDFDGNGIISYVDALKVLGYYSGSFNDASLPGPVGADSQAIATTRTYVRHYFNNNVTNPVTEYSLTVNPYDNTNTSPNANSQQRLIIGENDMIIDNDTAVVCLCDTNSGNGYGSGFIISDHIIVTAAHCVFNYSYHTSSTYDNFKVKLTDNNNNTIYGTPEYVDIPKNYATRGDNNFDYALIYVEEDLSEYGSFQLGAVLDEYIDNNGEVTVSGFPATSGYPDEYIDQPSDLRFKATGKLLPPNSEISPSKDVILMYDADMTFGDSGGPVYVHESFTTQSDSYDYNTVIGINTREWEDSYYQIKENRGIRITPDHLKFYNDNPYIEY